MKPIKAHVEDLSMENQTLIHVDLLAMNVSWTPKDLELFEIEFDLLVSTICTIARFITFVTAIVVHRAFYRLMKRLPGRAVNQVIYPYMVSKSIIISKNICYKILSHPFGIT